MKITTKDQFWQAADNWYQRTHKLREVFQNPEASDIKRMKAFVLWNIMIRRMMKVKDKAIEITQPKPFKFPKGGI